MNAEEGSKEDHDGSYSRKQRPDFGNRPGVARFTCRDAELTASISGFKDFCRVMCGFDHTRILDSAIGGNNMS